MELIEGALYTASVELAFLFRDASTDIASGQDTLMLRRPNITVYANNAKHRKQELPSVKVTISKMKLSYP